MFRRAELHIALGFLAEIAPPGPNRAEFAFLRALREALGSADLPVHWVFPPMLFEASPASSFADLRGIVGERIDRGVDRAVVVGYRGSFHPLLSLRDVGRDLRWATRNPWGTGTAGAVAAAPVAVLPFHPDLGRPGMLACFREAGFDTVLFLRRPSKGASWAPVYRDAASGVRLLPALRASNRLPAALASLGVRGGLFLLFDAAGRPFEDTRELLGRLRRRYRLRVVALPDHGLPEAAVSPEELGAISWADLPCTPIARRAWLGAEPLRRSSRNADGRELLGALAHRQPAFGAPPEPAGELAVPSRHHTSVMPGLVTLAGSAFDVRLDGGLLCGLVASGKPLFPLARARSFLAAGKATTPFAVASAASFEDDRTRGLRAQATVSGGAIVIDYSVADSLDALLIDLYASYPRLAAGATAVCPFGIAVDATGADAVVLRCIAPDGSAQERRIDLHGSAGEVHTVAGSAFVVELGGRALCLSFPARRGLSSLPLQCLLTPRGERQLLLNPFGTFHRSEAAAYSGMREQVRLLLSLGREPPRLPRPLLRSGPEHLVLRAPGAPETERATPSRPPRRAR